MRCHTSRRREVWQRMLMIAERDDPVYTLIHQNANFTAKRRDIGWRPSQSFFMDFSAANWGVTG
jgi:peptide/nickel transport system substrate-binding protein